MYSYVHYRAYTLVNMVTDNSHCINTDLVSLDQEC